jgi:hypothetical protein
MNLFVTSNCPTNSAIALDDKRVGKMLMEANQMLSLAIKLHVHQVEWEEKVGEGRLSKGMAHRNHPVSKWVRLTEENFRWTIDHAFALGAEFEFRFGKRHASSFRTVYIWETFGTDFFKDDIRTPYQNSAKNDSIGVDMTHLSVPESYRRYLDARWEGDSRPPKWTKRGQPKWSEFK